MGNPVDVHASITNLIATTVTTNDARYNAALTNMPTLQDVVTAGNTATGIGDLTIDGRVVNGSGLDVANIAANSYGAQQRGLNTGTMTIGANSSGAQQSGENTGTMTIGGSSSGAQQDGWNYGTMTIGVNSPGAQQVGKNYGTMTIGEYAIGAQQRGYVAPDASATNGAMGSMQLLNLTDGQSATITSAGSASIGLGACEVSNKQSIVAGDGQVSHGNGSITAGGGFFGNGAGLTNITAAQVGAATTSAVSFAAAPACYQLTLTNTSALSWTNTWMPTSKVSRVTLTSTGTVTFVWNWPTQQDAGMRFALDRTGMPSVVFPAGAIYLTNGIYGTSAPVLGKSNYVSVIHDDNAYQIMVITNTLGTWGTP
jgi:hypothetical protein